MTVSPSRSAQPANMKTPQGNGLHTWRERKRQEKEALMAELDEYRKAAVRVEREGREFLLVRIPDGYKW